MRNHQLLKAKKKGNYIKQIHKKQPENFEACVTKTRREIIYISNLNIERAAAVYSRVAKLVSYFEKKKIVVQTTHKHKTYEEKLK